MHKNLWPDFDLAQASRSPKAIIEEAGGGLGKKTRGLVEFHTGPTSIEYDVVSVTFNFYIDALSYYFPFLRANWSVGSSYPVTVVVDKMPDVVAKDEDELGTALAKIFRAPSTIATIQRLMSLAQ